MIDENGLSALLVASFYGHADCVRTLLECPPISASSSSDDVGEEDAGGSDAEEQRGDDKTSNLLSENAPPLNPLRYVALQWQFEDVDDVDRCRGGNFALLNPQNHLVDGGHLCARFNALHIAIMTGQVVWCLCCWALCAFGPVRLLFASHPRHIPGIKHNV